MALLSLQNISFSYDKTPVLKDISYDFEKGKMYCIIGKSGAGKTTLLSLLSGLATPSEGEIVYDGKSSVLANLPLNRLLTLIIRGISRINYTCHLLLPLP